MLKYAMATALFALASTGTHAQGYVGAVRSLTNLGYDCPAGADCRHQGKGWKLYAGTRLSPASVLDLSIGKVDTLEFAYLKFNGITSRGAATTVGYLDELGEAKYRSADTTLKVQSDVLSFAAVARFPLFDDMNFAAKAGVAYVSSTVRVDLEGVSYSSETATKFKPYLGFSLEYEIPSVLRLVGSFDYTQYDVGGKRGGSTMFGIGAEKSF